MNFDINNIIFNKYIKEKHFKTGRFSKKNSKYNFNTTKSLIINNKYKTIDKKIGGKKTIDSNTLNIDKINLGRNYKDKLKINSS